MAENPLAISKLNDFIFCPVSIFFHRLDMETDEISMQDEYQLNGTAAHSAVDNARYSTRKNILQSLPIYSEKYNLYGKIDVYDADKKILTERKKKIVRIYDGYVFQLYAQYYGLKEQGYDVQTIRLYSMDDNKIYPVALPDEDREMSEKFNKLLFDINSFKFENFSQSNRNKCRRCIYEPLCSYSALTGDL